MQLDTWISTNQWMILKMFSKTFKVIKSPHSKFKISIIPTYFKMFDSVQRANVQ